MIKIEGKVVYQGDRHDVVCNGKNHYGVNETLGVQLLCGCFCRDPQFVSCGFDFTLMNTPVVDDGIVIPLEDDMIVNWAKKYL